MSTDKEMIAAALAEVVEGAPARRKALLKILPKPLTGFDLLTHAITLLGMLTQQLEHAPLEVKQGLVGPLFMSISQALDMDVDEVVRLLIQLEEQRRSTV